MYLFNQQLFRGVVFLLIFGSIAGNVSPLHEVADFQHFWLQI